MGEDKINSLSEEEPEQEENAFVTHKTVFNYVKSTKQDPEIKGEETGPFMLTEEGETPPIFVDILSR